MSLYQEQRQQLKDKIIGLAAALAGLRSNIIHNTKTADQLTDTFKINSQLLNVREELSEKAMWRGVGWLGVSLWVKAMS